MPTTRPKAKTPPAFVTLMRLLREDSGYSEGRFAVDVLGISHSQWSHVVVTQIRGAGGTFLAAVIRRYPHLVALIGQAHAGQLDHLDAQQLRTKVASCRPEPVDPSTSNVQHPTLVALAPTGAD